MAISDNKYDNSFKRRSKKLKWRLIAENYELYLFLVPALLYIIIFHYIPIYGIQLAFKKYMPLHGIWGSPWVGFQQFEMLFNSPSFWRLIRNTVWLSLYSLIAGFPLPIILALLLQHLPNALFKKIVQMISYAPHFISVVVIVGMINVLLAPNSGVINHLLAILGFERIYFMAKPEFFPSIYVWSGIWQRLGFGSIIYMAALSGISQQVHEAAIVDGANKLQRIWYIDIPGIIPTAIILLILNAGNIMSVGFEKVLLMQNPLNMSTAEVISTYVYKVGLQGGRFEFGTAVGLFNSLLNAFLLVLVNQIARSYSENTLL